MAHFRWFFLLLLPLIESHHLLVCIHCVPLCINKDPALREAVQPRISSQGRAAQWLHVALVVSCGRCCHVSSLHSLHGT